MAQPIAVAYANCFRYELQCLKDSEYNFEEQVVIPPSSLPLRHQCDAITQTATVIAEQQEHRKNVEVKEDELGMDIESDSDNDRDTWELESAGEKARNFTSD